MFSLQVYLSLFLVAISLITLLADGKKVLDGMKGRNKIMLAVIALIFTFLLLMD